MEIFTTIMLLLVLMNGSLGTKHVVYWDQEQIPILTKGGLEITLEVNDYMDLLCPYAPGEYGDKKNKVLLQLFNVTRDEYMICDTKHGIRLQTCNEPFVEKKLTTKFQERSPYPYGFTFTPGETYYYISKPLHDISRGCTQDTMKMLVNVRRKGTVFPMKSRDRTITYHLKNHQNSDSQEDTNPPHSPHRHHHHEKPTTQKPTTTTSNRPKVIIKFETPSSNRKTQSVRAQAVRNSSPPGNSVSRLSASFTTLIILYVLLNKAINFE